MPRAFISHSSADRQLVLRLAEDLRRNWIEVWLDEWDLRVGDNLVETIESSLEGASHLIIVLSEASVDSAWVKRELEFAVRREKDRQGMIIVPALLSPLEIPPEVRGKPAAEFFTGYDKGLEALLGIFSSASLGVRAQLPGRRFVSAQRGRGAGLSAPSHLSCVVVGGRDWSFASATETQGDPALRGRLSLAINKQVSLALRQFQVSAGPESLALYIQIANAAVIAFKEDLGLDIHYPLGARMSLLVQYKSTVCVSTVGATSALARYAVGEDYAVMRIESASNVALLEAQGAEPGLSVNAPLGFMVPDTEPDWKQVELSSSGDFVALATFRFPRNGLDQLGSTLVRERDPERIAVLLAETHWPRTLDSLCGLLVKETS